MARAGVIDHPEEWEESGFYENRHPKKRYAIIYYALLLKTRALSHLKNFRIFSRNGLKMHCKRTVISGKANGQKPLQQAIKLSLKIYGNN
jgi:hypothetical protein